jgi:Fe-S-cluster-containing dehydrogenase component
MDINRRGFLKIIGAAGAGGFMGGSQKVLAQEYFPGHPDRFGVLTDLTRCVGCRTCEAACNQINNLPKPEIPFDDTSVFEEKREADAKYYTYVNRYDNLKGEGESVYRKVQCNHCDEPACASACLVRAIEKTPEGPVVWNEKLCIGCRYCMTACPFYVPAFEYSDPLSPNIVKCTMCYDTRVSKGDVPACVEACPMEAMTFGKRSDVIKAARQRIRKGPDRYIEHIFGEHEIGGTSWLYISGVPFEQLGFPTHLGNKPCPEFTRGFLSMVPAVLVIWPALLWGFYRFSQHREQAAEDENAILEEKERQV